MRKVYRMLSAFLCALFLFRLACAANIPSPLYFVAAENIVVPLSSDTMPFWRDGYLYISSDIFTGAVRDALGISRAKIGDSALLYRGEMSLLFRPGYPYAQDTNEETYAPGMVWHENSAYVPASVVARYFNLLYSIVDVEHGKLVWLRNASFQMKDEAFAKAATFQLDKTYQEYLKEMEKSVQPEEPWEPEYVWNPAPPEEPEPERVEPPETVAESVEPDPPPAVTEEPSKPASTAEPSAPSKAVTATEPPVTPSKPATTEPPAPSKSATATEPPAPSKPVTATEPPVTPSKPATTAEPPAPSDPVTTTPAPEPVAPTVEPEPETIPGGQSVYLCLRGDSNTPVLLDALDRRNLRAAVFCDETFLSEQGDLLRRMAATGHVIGLSAPSGPPASVLDTLEACNRQLQRTTMEKTRFVLLDGDGDELRRALQDAGFLCVRPSLDASASSLRTSRQAAELLKRVSQQSGRVTLLLGDSVNRSGLNAFLSGALDVEDACLPLTETALS